jgi:ubiquinone/menaquinone biosynthesis C-methylase UbiE
VLEWIRQHELPGGSRILDVGCGAGGTAVDLARLGFTVDAVDGSTAMLERARTYAEETGTAGQTRFVQADAHALPYPDDSFDVVTALGLIPWLEDPVPTVAEIARVLRPRGIAILTSDNKMRLTFLLDPAFAPPLAPVRRIAKWVLRSLAIRDGRAGAEEWRPYRRRFIDDVLSDSGLRKVRETSVGFGPFTFFGHAILGESRAIQLNKALQRLADRRFPVLRSLGAHYIVLAERHVG